MKQLINKVDWNYLARAMIALGVCISVGATIVIMSDVYVEQKRRLNNSSQVNLNKMKIRFQDAVKNRQLVAEHLQAYQALVKRGFVGDENRLDWVESLRKISKSKKVTAIDYDIKAIQPYVSGKNINPVIFQINASEMVLSMKLMHERDLLDIFSELNRRTAGIYDIQGCMIRRQGQKIQFDYNAVNIIAECTLNWFTIMPKGGA